MEKTDVTKANALVTEYNGIDAAWNFLDAGDPITDMTVSGVTFSTADMMEYVPPQMLATIKDLIRKRQAAITAELNSMGVTGTTERAARKK